MIKMAAAAIVVLVASVLTGAGQDAGTVRRVAFLAVGESLDAIRPSIIAELGRQGFIESRNLVVDERVGPGPKLHSLARDLASLRPRVVIAIGTPAVTAAAQTVGHETAIVGWFGADPVALGFADSHARPGRNITGFLVLAAELDGKRLDILREAVPGARRLGVLALNPTRHELSLAAMREVASRAGIDLNIVYAESEKDYAAAFMALRAAGAEGLVIAGAREFHQNAARLAALAREAQLATACEWAQMAREGCLLGYGASFESILNRTGHYVAQILRGASPAELPIEHPSRLEFAVNLKTARALKLDIPPGLLLRADEVIE